MSLYSHIYSPGIGTDHNTDKLIDRNCKDADIFVYVCNGISTLERQVSLFSTMEECIVVLCIIVTVHVMRTNVHHDDLLCNMIE